MLNSGEEEKRLLAQVTSESNLQEVQARFSNLIARIRRGEL